MIISHKHHFIFIKTHKTAGTSIEHYLSQYCGPNDIITPFGKEILGKKFEGHNPRNYEGFYSHTSCKEIRLRIPQEVWENYFKFTFERNPWDKMVSRFWHQGKVNDKLKKLSFEEFCTNCKNKNFPFPSDFELYTIEGKVSVDFIGKYEHLLKDLCLVCDKLNIPFEPPLPKLKSEFRISKEHYSKFYNEYTKNLVQTQFVNEIELLDYVFEME